MDQTVAKPGSMKTLLVFPHAGSIGHPYSGWTADFRTRSNYKVKRRSYSKSVDGRPGIERHVDDAIKILDTTPAKSIICYGHSFGALIAFETARAIQNIDADGVCLLVVSGSVAPGELTGRIGFFPEEYRSVPVTDIPDSVFEDFLRAHSNSTLGKDLLEVLVLQLRQDLTHYQNYRFVDGRRLTCPILVINGTDEHFSEKKLKAWEQLSSGEVTFQVLPGNHMGIVENDHGVRQLLSEIIDSSPPFNIYS
jgi:surfactin synthase thioesterase subunit